MYILLITLMLNIDNNIEQTYHFDSETECLSAQSSQIQILDTINQSSIIGYSTQCIKQ